MYLAQKQPGQDARTSPKAINTILQMCGVLGPSRGSTHCAVSAAREKFLCRRIPARDPTRDRERAADIFATCVSTRSLGKLFLRHARAFGLLSLQPGPVC